MIKATVKNDGTVYDDELHRSLSQRLQSAPIGFAELQVLSGTQPLATTLA